MNVPETFFSAKIPELIKLLKPLFYAGDFDQIHKILTAQFENLVKERETMIQRLNTAEGTVRQSVIGRSVMVLELQKSQRECRKLEMQVKKLSDNERVLHEMMRQGNARYYFDQQRKFMFMNGQNQVIWKLNAELEMMKNRTVVKNKKAKKIVREDENLVDEGKLLEVGASKADQNVEEQKRGKMESVEGMEESKDGALSSDDGTVEEMRRRLAEAEKIIGELRSENLEVRKAVEELRRQNLKEGPANMLNLDEMALDNVKDPFPEDGQQKLENDDMPGVTTDVDLFKRGGKNLTLVASAEDEVASDKNAETSPLDGAQSDGTHPQAENYDTEGMKKRKIFVVSDSSEDEFSDDDSCSSSGINELLSSLRN